MLDNMEYHAIMDQASQGPKSPRTPTIHTGDPWTPMQQQHPHLVARQHSTPSQPRTPPAYAPLAPTMSSSTPLLGDVSFEGPVPPGGAPVMNGQNGGPKGIYRSPPPSNSSGSLGRHSTRGSESDYVNSDVVTDRGESTV